MASGSTVNNLRAGDSLVAAVKGKSSRDLKSEYRRHLGVQDTKEFLSDIRGRRTRWPLLIAISLIAVSLLGYSASRILFERAQSLSISEEQNAAGVGAVDAEPSASGAGAVKLESLLQRPVDQQKQRKAFAFSLQSEAEAAVEDGFARALEKQGTAAEPQLSVIDEQVHSVLKAASDAVRIEDLDSFLGLLDESEESFVREQTLKAKVAFRQFDEIDGKYSDVKVKVLNDNELAVSLHCKVKAAYSKSGRSIVLFNGDQNITLRKAAGAAWKICSID
jgi:hypothetical protein